MNDHRTIEQRVEALETALEELKEKAGLCLEMQQRLAEAGQ